MVNSVLVIDDSQFDRLIAKKVLELAQFSREVATVKSVLEAIEYLESRVHLGELLPEVIFVDIRMPEHDGFTFLERMAVMPDIVKNSCKVYMLSSSVDSEDIKRAQRCEYVEGFVSKPLSREKLLCLVMNKIC